MDGVLRAPWGTWIDANSRPSSEAMRFPRSSGLLLHPTSLPGPYGIGDLGPEALRFAGFLSEAGQTLRQVLPLGPTGFGDLPMLLRTGRKPAADQPAAPGRTRLAGCFHPSRYPRISGRRS
jgi:hypothetical protein